METVIYQYLMGCNQITALLTKYNDIPAIFNREAPPSVDSLWSTSQYPRLIFELSMQEDPERQTSGTLMVDFYFNTDRDLFIEDIEPVIRDAIDGYFFSCSGDTLATLWRHSDPFTEPAEGSRINGVTITFDVVSFPLQYTSYPCPVVAMDSYLKRVFPAYKVLGHENFVGVWKTTDDIPAIYTRLQRIDPGTYPSKYAVTWYSASLVVHVMAPSLDIRNGILKELVERLQQEERVMMPDGSPMFVQRLALTAGADQLKAGQLVITGQYGLLRNVPDVPKMEHVVLKG